MPITVIDALMGEGKTTYIFDMMRSSSEDRYIYIGISLDESNRCTRECPDLKLRNPIPDHGRKYWDLDKLVKAGENVASTHQLFRHMAMDLYGSLKGKEYTLVIDEALDVVSQYPIGKAEFEALL